LSKTLASVFPGSLARPLTPSGGPRGDRRRRMSFSAPYARARRMRGKRCVAL